MKHSGCGISILLRKYTFDFVVLQYVLVLALSQCLHAVLQAVRALLSASLKTSTLNIIAVVT